MAPFLQGRRRLGGSRRATRRSTSTRADRRFAGLIKDALARVRPVLAPRGARGRDNWTSSTESPDASKPPGRRREVGGRQATTVRSARDFGHCGGLSEIRGVAA